MMEPDSISSKVLRDCYEYMRAERVPPAVCGGCGKSYYFFFSEPAPRLEALTPGFVYRRSLPIPRAHWHATPWGPRMNCMGHTPSDLVVAFAVMLDTRTN